MKKLKLSALDLSTTEVLSRAQLKNVLGGGGSGSALPPINCTIDITTDDGVFSTTTGLCASTDQALCNSYAEAQCISAREKGYTCEWGCF